MHPCISYDFIIHCNRHLYRSACLFQIAEIQFSNEYIIYCYCIKFQFQILLFAHFENLDHVFMLDFRCVQKLNLKIL